MNKHDAQVATLNKYIKLLRSRHTKRVVLWDERLEIADEIERLEEGYDAARELFSVLAPQCELLDSPSGVISQINNYIAGLKAEIERLRREGDDSLWTRDPAGISWRAARHWEYIAEERQNEIERLTKIINDAEHDDDCMARITYLDDVRDWKRGEQIKGTAPPLDESLCDCFKSEVRDG